jgi:hypothetical protein
VLREKIRSQGRIPVQEFGLFVSCHSLLLPSHSMLTKQSVRKALPISPENPVSKIGRPQMLHLAPLPTVGYALVGGSAPFRL